MPPKTLAREAGFIIEKDRNNDALTLVDLEEGNKVKTFSPENYDALTLQTFLRKLYQVFEVIPDIRVDFETIRDEVVKEIYPHGEVRYSLIQTPSLYYIYRETESGGLVMVGTGMKYRHAMVEWASIALYESP